MTSLSGTTATGSVPINYNPYLPLAGSCGSAATGATSAPTANLCLYGTPSSVSGSGPWTWTCAGSNGGNAAICTAATTWVNGSCSGLPINAAFYGGATVYSLTGAPNGTSLTAGYNASPTANTCQFNCNTNYTWNGSTCAANTQTNTCSGLPSNASWNTVSSYIQTWTGSGWSPTATTGSYNATASTTSCVFKCNTNYTWNGSSCVANTQSATCWWSIPSNALATTATTYTQTWNGTAWAPTTSWSYGAGSCGFSCNGGYSWSGGVCAAPTLANANGEWPEASCTAAGQTYTATTTYSDPVAGTCNTPDKVLCTRSGYGQVWAMCNAGSATTSGYGGYYQWGNNGDVGSAAWSTSGQPACSTVGNNSSYSQTDYFYQYQNASDYDWCSGTQDNNAWGDTSDSPVETYPTYRQGPCAAGYHVPSKSQWSYVYNN